MMSSGNVTVDADESHTGSGLALARYEADKASMEAAGMLPEVPAEGLTAPPYSAARPSTADDARYIADARLRLLREAARRASAWATADVTYLQANAKAHVTSESLGRTPSPNNPNTPIQPPSSAVDIPIL